MDVYGPLVYRHCRGQGLRHHRPRCEEQTWRAFELVWLDQRPAAEAAQQREVPIDCMYVAKSRVLERLEQEVRNLAEESILFGR